jgi:hypothetical protein
VELFVRREDAERLVRDWDQDEPEQAGLVHVEIVELETSPNLGGHRHLTVRRNDRAVAEGRELFHRCSIDRSFHLTFEEQGRKVEATRQVRRRCGEPSRAAPGASQRSHAGLRG